MFPLARTFSLLTKAPRHGRVAAAFPGNPWDEMDKFFQSAWPFEGERKSLWPKVDIVEKPEAWEMHLDVPGVNQEDIDVRVHNGVVEISGKRSHEIRDEEQEKNLRRVERTFGSFKRTFSLPDAVDESKIHARLDQGVLELTLPKVPIQKPEARTVPISAGPKAASS